MPKQAVLFVLSGGRPVNVIMDTARIHFSNRDILLLFLPIAGELLLHYTVGIVDSIMVASVGEAAVSGVSLMDFVISFFNSLLTALAVGGTVVIGQYLGNADRPRAADAAVQMVLLMALAGTLLALAAYALQPFITGRLFGDLAPDVRRHADVYFGILAASLPFMGVYSAGAAVFRSIGNTVLPLRIMILANVLNVAGNAVLIYGFDMETEGIALPTLAVRVLSAAAILLLLAVHARRRGVVPRFRVSMGIARSFFVVGVPYSFENGMFYLGRVLVLIMVASFGTASIAANAVAQAVTLFQVLPGMAAAAGIPLVVSRCVGAGDFRLARLYNRRIVTGIYAAHLASCALVTALLPVVLDVYGLSPEATSMARDIILVHALFVVLVWPMSYALPATFRAAGDTRFPMVVSVTCMLLCRVVFSYILGISFGLGVLGVWLGLFVDWMVKGLVFLLRYLSGKWQNYRLVD